ncbi:galectin-8-like [Glandiceps talaboti]
MSWNPQPPPYYTPAYPFPPLPEPAPYTARPPAISNPAIPYVGNIPNGMKKGTLITIYGSVPQSCERFHVNLTVGVSTQPRADIALHFNPRVKQGAVVRNTLQNEKWQKEERDMPFSPFQCGENFELMILSQKEQYKVAVNGKHFIEYKHRIRPLKNINTLQINGEVSIQSISIHGPDETRGSMSSGMSMPQGACGGVITNPSLPYSGCIPGGMYPGRLIYVSGIANSQPDRFRVDLCKRDSEVTHHEIALHLNPRFGKSQIVCNTKKNDKWGAEERNAPYFPFAPNTNFEIIILCEPGSYKVAVNGRHLLEYAHRIPLNEVETILVGGNIRVTQICFK